MENQEVVPPAAELENVSQGQPGEIKPPPPAPPPNPAPGDPAHLEAIQTLQALDSESADLRQSASEPVTDLLAGWLVPHYTVAARQKLRAAAPSRRWNLLRSLINDCAKLRRSDQRAARLQLLRAELELQRSCLAAAKEKQYQEWKRRPQLDEFGNPVNKNIITSETLDYIEKELDLL